MSISDLHDHLVRVRDLADRIATEAEAAALQQHEPYNAEALRAISGGAQFMAGQAQAMQQALERMQPSGFLRSATQEVGNPGHRERPNE